MSAPVCTVGCAANKVPPVQMDVCAPKTVAGQLLYLYVANVGQPFANIEDLVEWVARQDNTSTDADAVRKLHIIGSKPAAEGTEKTISLNRIITGVKNHQWAIRIDELNDLNYDFMRSIECGGSFLIWPQDSAGYIYGGNTGIKATISLNHVIPENITDLQELVGTAKASMLQHPDRNVSPIA